MRPESTAHHEPRAFTMERAEEAGEAYAVEEIEEAERLTHVRPAPVPHTPDDDTVEVRLGPDPSAEAEDVFVRAHSRRVARYRNSYDDRE